MVLNAGDVLERDFLSLPGSTDALAAAKLMREGNHGFVIVTLDGKPSGIVTEWDYLSKVVAAERTPSETALSEIMSGQLLSVPANTGLDTVANLMAEKGVRRLLVVQDGRVVGVITARIILGRLKEYVDKISTTIARLQAPPF